MENKVTKSSPRTYKYLDLIIWLNVVSIATAIVVSGKIIQISIFTLSAASILIPVNYIIGDLLTEVYGYKQARRATWIQLLTNILIVVIFQIVVFLPPAPGFNGNEAYSLILGLAPRVAVGGILALFTGQFANDFVIAKMKVLTKGKYLWMRTISSTIVGQFADTTSFYIIALFNVIPKGLLINAILSAWFLKVLIEVIMTPVTYFVITKLKKLENEDYFDKNTNFNPLIIDLERD